MKIPTPKYSKKKIIIITIVVVILIAALFSTYLYAFKGKLFGWSPIEEQKEGSSINYDKPTEDQKKTGENTKKQNVTKDEAKPNTGGSDQPSAPIPQSNGKSKVDMMISAANQNGAILQIRTIISTVTNSGTCTLTLTKSGQTVTKTAGVQALASDSTCKGFDVPTSELSPGSWQASVRFENNELQADASQAVTVR